MQILAATKYLATQDMPLLARAGVELVGENRAQDLPAKVVAHDDLFSGTSSVTCRAERCVRSFRTCA